MVWISPHLSPDDIIKDMDSEIIAKDSKRRLS